MDYWVEQPWSLNAGQRRVPFFWKDEINSTESPLIRRQTVVLDDDHVADAEICRGKLPLVALVEHFKELIRASSSALLMESF